MRQPATHHTLQIIENGKPLNIEYQWVGSPDPQAPLLVFLHEGLGSITHWSFWPEELASVLGCRGLLYSRPGYGHSTPRNPNDDLPITYLHHEAEQRLPAVLAALGLADEQPILFGHSDGGTIALLNAAMPTSKARAIICVAPHINVEPFMHHGLEHCINWYESGDLRQRLARYHQDVDGTFKPWSRAWCSDSFKNWNIESEVAAIRCPTLLIQGDLDEYSSLHQIYGIQRLVPHAQAMVLAGARHSPHFERPERLQARCLRFLRDHDLLR